LEERKAKFAEVKAKKPLFRAYEELDEAKAQRVEEELRIERQ
jgi:hypothetical protein